MLAAKHAERPPEKPAGRWRSPWTGFLLQLCLPGQGHHQTSRNRTSALARSNHRQGWRHTRRLLALTMEENSCRKSSPLCLSLSTCTSTTGNTGESTLLQRLKWEQTLKVTDQSEHQRQQPAGPKACLLISVAAVVQRQIYWGILHCYSVFFFFNQDSTFANYIGK